MEKQISFDGVSLTPYNDISPDGQLSACCGLERHAGSLRPVALVGSRHSKSDIGSKLVFVHNTANYNHFIFYNSSSGSLSWSEQSEELSLIPFGSVTGLVSVNAIGNTLIVTTQEKMVYYLYSDYEKTYKDLGQFPEVSLSFGLLGMCKKTTTKSVTIETIRLSDINKDFSDNNRTIITNSVMSEVNTFISEYNQKYGRFMFPFLLRYALRMYDGTLIHHSAPILMLCMNRNMYAIVSYNKGDREITEMKYVVSGSTFAIDYMCTQGQDSLSSWSDIIQSVDVFISEPAYSFFPDKDCERFTNGLMDSASAVCKQNTNYEKLTFKQMYTNAFGPDDPSQGTMLVELPYKTEEEINRTIEECSTFYLIKSIPSGSLSGSRTKLDISDGIISNLTSQERMTDDYQSHDKLCANYTYTYNQRLSLANVRKTLFKGFNTESLFCYNNGSSAAALKCYVYIKEDSRDIIVENDTSLNLVNDNLTYFFYPNTNAYKVVINNQSESITFNLTPHPLLNGAYYFNGFVSPPKSGYISVTPSPDKDRIVRLPNKLYTSEVGNPFYFPLRGINTVGVGEIVGVSSVTAALSQGQFGSFPLMAFCTDGNYALQVSSEGLFSGVFPMQRDVCVNKDSITQIDGAVVFVSSRGVMVADGSVINCISDILNGVFDSLDFIPDMEAFRYSIPDKAPIDFFRSCLIAYDYAGRRLLFFSRELNDDAVWVLSLEDNTWSQAEIQGVSSVLNSYPYSYIELDGGHTIVRLDEAYRYTSQDSASGLVVTRPLKLDSYQLKALRQVALVGSFTRAQTVGIYGSNDGVQWFALGKSKAGRILTPGRYFKYYRFSIETDLDNSENISGLRIEYDVRPERRFR